MPRRSPRTIWLSRTIGCHCRIGRKGGADSGCRCFDSARRACSNFSCSAAVTLGFVVLRATNLYGDPALWAIQDSLLATVLSFINCEKYLPSLLYLAMTLGPAPMLVAALESVRGPVADWIATFGRVPFFYYVVHIFLLHASAVAGESGLGVRAIRFKLIDRRDPSNE